MANTTTFHGVTIEITGLDVDWWWKVDLPAFIRNPNGIWLESIQFRPSAANDRMIVRDGGLDNAPIIDVTCSSATDQKIEYIKSKALQRPVIDIDDCTLSTPANCKVIMKIR